MTWAIAYHAVSGAVFDVIATWSDDKGAKPDVILSISVNFDSPGSVDDLIERCKKALAVADAEDDTRTKYADVFAKLEAQLNGG